MNQTAKTNSERFPLVVRRARIKSGSFIGCEQQDLVSALDIADGKLVSIDLSKQEPKAIFGLFAQETRGKRNLGWWKNGKQV